MFKLIILDNFVKMENLYSKIRKLLLPSLSLLMTIMPIKMV